MTRTILLDPGTLGMITNPSSSPSTDACGRWFENAIRSGAEVGVPEIADYELR